MAEGPSSTHNLLSLQLSGCTVMVPREVQAGVQAPFVFPRQVRVTVNIAGSSGSPYRGGVRLPVREDGRLCD